MLPNAQREGYLCWRAVCEEARMHGSEGGGRKRTGPDTTREGFWQVEAPHSTSLAPYPTNDVQREGDKLSPDLACGLFFYVHYKTFDMASPKTCWPKVSLHHGGFCS